MDKRLALYLGRFEAQWWVIQTQRIVGPHCRVPFVKVPWERR